MDVGGAVQTLHAECVRLESLIYGPLANSTIVTDVNALGHPSESYTRRSPPSGEVHVWRIALAQADDVVERLKNHLADDELAKAARYHFASDRRRSIVRRAALRTILAGYLVIDPAAIQFTYGPQGKPAAATPGGELHFNASHSGELALVAVAGQPLGVDLERWREVADADLVARRFFTPDEVAVQRAAADPNRLFLQHWTRKEAIIKAVGKGLTMPLNAFDVSAAGAGQVVMTHEAGEQKWHLQDLQPRENYLAALATAEPLERTGWRDWHFLAAV